MPGLARREKGGSDAAFFLFFLFLAVATLGLGGSHQIPLFILRWGAFLAAAIFLWRQRDGGIACSGYALLTGGFILLAVGHSFSSVYFWVSFQHALNIGTAAIFLSWACVLFRDDAERTWRNGFLLVLGIAIAEVMFSLYQRYFVGESRPHGTFDNPNFLAEFLSICALFALARLIYRRDRVPIRIALAGLCVIFLLSALSLSESRGVLLALVPAAGILLIARYGITRGGAALFACGLPVLALVGYRSIARFFSTDIYNYGRAIIWKSALRTFVDNPEGVGLGGYKYYWYATQDPVAGAFRKYAKFAATAHNEYLEVLTGLGAVGLVLFLLVLIVPLLRAWKGRRAIPAGKREMAAAVAAGLILSGTHAAFDFNFHEFGIVYVDAMMLGALIACWSGEAAGPRWRVPPWGVWGGILVCAVLLVVSLCVVVGAAAHEKGEGVLRKRDERGAERLFKIAATVDPFRAPYADSLSAMAYRRYVREARRTADGPSGAIVELNDSVRWQTRALSLNPRESKYLHRLSFLLAERYRATGRPGDMESALRLASESLRINPYRAEALWYRSGLSASVGRVADARKDLERAVAIEPNFCRGYGKLSEMSAASDPGKAATWKEEEESCRRRAAGHPLEDFEKWLVEDPEEK